MIGTPNPEAAVEEPVEADGDQPNSFTRDAEVFVPSNRPSSRPRATLLVPGFGATPQGFGGTPRGANMEDKDPPGIAPLDEMRSERIQDPSSFASFDAGGGATSLTTVGLHPQDAELPAGFVYQLPLAQSAPALYLQLPHRPSLLDDPYMIAALKAELMLAKNTMQLPYPTMHQQEITITTNQAKRAVVDNSWRDLLNAPNVLAALQNVAAQILEQEGNPFPTMAYVLQMVAIRLNYRQGTQEYGKLEKAWVTSSEAVGKVKGRDKVVPVKCLFIQFREKIRNAHNKKKADCVGFLPLYFQFNHFTILLFCSLKLISLSLYS